MLRWDMYHSPTIIHVHVVPTLGTVAGEDFGECLTIPYLKLIDPTAISADVIFKLHGRSR